VRSIENIVEFLEKKAPKESAESWDNVGLLIGSLEAQTSSIEIALDLTFEVLESAIQNKSQAIILHHPCIFPRNKGLSGLVKSNKKESISSLIYRAIENNISIIACHTNFDQCSLEVTEKIATQLGCQPVGRLMESLDSQLLKLVVFTPITHSQKIRESLWDAGAGQLGFYDQCQFTVSGQGSFRALDGAQPFLGKVGKAEFIEEDRLEFVFPKTLKNKIVSALYLAHPYEEIAFDLIEVKQKAPKNGLIKGLGYGFIGEFKESIGFSELAKRVKSSFNIENFWFTGSLIAEKDSQGQDWKVKRIAFSPGKGSSFISSAIQSRCDVYIMGEVGYHSSQEAARAGLSIIELGHRESEKFFLEVMKDWVKQMGLKAFVNDTRIQKFY